MTPGKLVLLSVLLLVYSLLAGPYVATSLPDLTIKQYEFVSHNDKWVRVLVTNEGKTASQACRLELAIRKINGSAVTRSASETVPALGAGKEEWITINTSGILQSAVSLKDDTSFRLRVDETNNVPESNEDNNESWHNPD